LAGAGTSGVGLAGQRVLELKSGQGWLTQRLSSHGALVVATESTAEMVDALRHKLNGSSEGGVELPGIGLEVVELDWLQVQGSYSSLMELTGAVGGWDLIVGADCVFLPELFQPLLQVIAVAIENSPKTPRVILATEHTILDTGAAAEFYEDWTDGAETVVGGAGGSRPETPAERHAHSVIARDVADSLKKLNAGRTVMSLAGFHPAIKTWENCNSRGDRVACYELRMLPRLKSSGFQVISGPSSLTGNRLLWKMTPGLPDIITPRLCKGTDAVFTTESIRIGDHGDVSGTRGSTVDTSDVQLESIGGFLVLLQGLDAEVPVPVR
jgi:hypothetical protein